jgi:two-component system cell cycle sensor histidine kinase/response regulator CckA
VKDVLRVLMVEDSTTDAKLTVQELRRLGRPVECERVEDAEGMRAALKRASWDAVLSDWSLPRFSALDAFGVLKEAALDIPFLIVSGTMGEDVAVAAMKLGVHDYLLKGRLARLVPAIERELRESAVRRAHREAQRALQVSETRFKRLAEAGMMGIVIADPGGRVLEANDTFLTMVGYDQQDLRGGKLNWAAMIPPEWRHQSELAGEHLRASGVARPWATEYVRKDGSRVPVLVAIATLDASQNISVSLDLSERKALEEQLRQSQKMEAFGSLAAGIAHDLNNLLSVIISYTSMILDGLKSSDLLRADLDEVKRAGDRAVDLTRQLLAFSRQQVLDPRIVDLNETLVQVDRMIRRIIGEHIELRTLPADGLWKVKVDPGQVEQVIMNLVVNARDAMPTGGTLTLESANVELDAAYAQEHAGVIPGMHAMLAVSDTGSGMSKEIQSRIFEPFFTTKERGKGTGLGLSTVFGIVKQSGGSVWVYSEPGVGTTFKIYFPRSLEAEKARRVSGFVRAPGGSETILLVEDEAPVRRVARTILTRIGYRVIEAVDPQDALRRATEFNGAIHLLVTDVVMPQMSGRALSERLVATRPETRVLFMSGYTDDTIVHHGALEPGLAFLQKPINPENLGRKVREVLDSTQT